MTIIETIRADFDEEMPATRKMLERVPSDRGEWRPHPKSTPLSHLAQLVSYMPWWIMNMATESKVDLETWPPYSYEKTEKLLADFDLTLGRPRARWPLCGTPGSMRRGRWWPATMSYSRTHEASCCDRRSAISCTIARRSPSIFVSSTFPWLARVGPPRTIAAAFNA
jgi:hypothetical protein